MSDRSCDHPPQRPAKPTTVSNRPPIAPAVLTRSMRADAEQLATTHRQAERAYNAAIQGARIFLRNRRHADAVQTAAVARRITDAQAALAEARDAAAGLAAVQLGALRRHVSELVDADRYVTIRGASALWRRVAEELGLEHANVGLRLCDGTTVLVEARLSRGELVIGSAAFYCCYGPGDPRVPRRERVR